MPTAEKAVKERDYTNAHGNERKNRSQMLVAKKERPNHKCWWQTKNGCPNQSSKQLTPNERNKTAETTSNPPNGCLPASIRWKKQTNKTTKSQQSNRLLSATKEWTTTVIRAQSKNNCANDKQMESQTNHN